MPLNAPKKSDLKIMYIEQNHPMFKNPMRNFWKFEQKKFKYQHCTVSTDNLVINP